ncbi:alpha-keto acid decarboxylase family protein [Flavobacterium johnsoniae]|uniref:Thiamine pyrophosphate enzyme TPP binding domain protein n=1 Tax=Flavobacterium johnsoniae (strain ATCC 17061 / DSM 2064 / JCM 8514 / BCRC 14874 / CCUG 350202 / NBRC 14942 / NCIMB 11054 / UW101) TaxID=376686 RepID=A5FD76_FLAJ1|nr:thiamine pyrophosphate-dependent enzyme [Flavobacterium johnsoniae]ABQ06847.1 thiamine pyrophosphate enzyme TPP binding domain protein [Flavobacterium johnsoniae UW101]OXE97292.1 thiamine pyrophosphate-binding protein [Flavobacterium johnsoniae UW101]WQG81319.1 thiamine pyrophosphate-binding protein [Flavobacterium johnsoniae UW101]
MGQKKISVAKYLQIRLEQLGLTHLFGIAGNYTAPFLNTIHEDKNAKIKIVNDTNEINAGHCTDAYARQNGFAAVAVTYGVGAFTLLNSVAGSYVEHCPVLVINGGPTNKDQQRSLVQGMLASHMTGDMYSNINVFRNVTVAAEQITGSSDAPYKIDSVLNACILYGRPVYLEVFEDAWRMECNPPDAPLAEREVSKCQSSARKAAKRVAAMAQGKEIIFWGGIEIQRYGIQKEFLDLIETTDTEFVTSILGKSIVSENHPKFKGVFNGKASPKDVKEKFEKAQLKIGLGVWTTGKNLGGFDVWKDDTVLANHSGVRIGASYIANVSLRDFMIFLKEELTKVKFSAYEMYDAEQLPESFFVADQSIRKNAKPTLTYDTFFKRINTFIDERHIVVADAGFPLLGAQGIRIAEPNGFVAQASWLSIGYSVPAATGIKCARPDKRPVVFVGDGAFQETCQAISTQNKLKHDTVVFVLDNGIYGIEQMLVNPNPFRGAEKVEYSIPDLNDIYDYNQMHRWKYAKLVDVFGGRGFEVSTLDELNEVLKHLENIKENTIVHVNIPKTSIPESIAYKTEEPGEDEFLDKDWSLC